MNFRNRHVRLLAALRYFDSDERRPMEDGPKGLGWGTVHDLEAAGLIVQSGDATSIRGRPFRTTAAGRALLAMPDPTSGLPKMTRWEFPEDGGEPVRVPSGTAADDATTPGKAVHREPAAPRPQCRDRMRTDRLTYPPRGLGRVEAARYVGISTSKFDELVADQAHRQGAGGSDALLRRRR